MPELDTLLFELKYIKKGDVPDPTSPAGKNIINKALSQATKQLKEYGAAKEFAGKKIRCWAIVFVGEKCVEKLLVKM
jgi:hypothetical protein